MALPTALTTLAASKATPFWGDNPTAWDTVVFIGQDDVSLPGLCRLTGTGFEQRVQTRRIPGQHGESISFLGREGASFEIDVRLWTAQHLTDFAKMLPRLEPVEAELNRAVVHPTGANPNLVDALPGFVGESEAGAAAAGNKVKKAFLPIQVYHPVLALFGVHFVHVLKIGLPERQGETDIYQARISCRQYVPESKRRAVVSQPAVKPAQAIATIPQANVNSPSVAGTKTP